MCKGIYSISPRELFVEAVVGIGSFAPANAATISFLVDTGATITIISAADAIRLGLSYNQQGQPLQQNGMPLRKAAKARGVGRGRLQLYHLDNVFLTLVSYGSDESERHTEYVKNISVAEPRYQDESLLGMDLLSRFRLLVDPKDLTVDLTRIPMKGTGYFVEHPT